MAETYKKKLIEVALPLEAINKASAREKSIRHGHPSTLHLWWARRPLAAARAVIFAQMVDDPSANPDLFRTEKEQDRERKRLFRIIEDLVLWENTNNETVIQRARDEIWQSWRRACAENADHPRAKELFDRFTLPAFHDPFAGGGSLPLEAQRLGLEAHASDLNPVAVLINKAMIEIPPRFTGKPPVNPEWQQLSKEEKILRTWEGARGLAEDVRYYGKWMRDEAKKRIGHLYPKVEITVEMVKERPDLKPYLGRKLTVIAWIWARTVKSPNPAFADVDVPLATTFILSKKKGKEVYVEPVMENGGYRFTVKVGKPRDAASANRGTKLARGANFQCVMSGSVINDSYIKEESMSMRMGSRLMAIAIEGDRERVYLEPIRDHESIALSAVPQWQPDQPMNRDTRDLVSGRGYGFITWADLFTPRQLVVLTTFSDLVGDIRDRVFHDACVAGLSNDSKSLSDHGVGANAYAEAIGVYIACGISRSADFWSNLCIWANQPKNEIVAHLFGRQAIPMAWDYAEANPFSESGGNFERNLSYVVKVVDCLPGTIFGAAVQADAQTTCLSMNKVVSTDPPYYDNISYADLSDYFYLWLRRSLRSCFPELFSTLVAPKAEELVASSYRHGSKSDAEKFFLDGMTEAMHQLAVQSHGAFPVTIYYAFKQTETRIDAETASTGWETFLGALIRANFAVSGTWPMRTERTQGLKGETNALASSIVLVCRKRSTHVSSTTRREFIAALKDELPHSLRLLQSGNIAPVDLAQAVIGPGMAIYTRYEKVLDAEGKALTIREALGLINQILDEALAEQEGDFDPDTRWAVAWFEQYGFAEGEYGVAETLATAKNTSVGGLRDANILVSKAGRVRLFKPEELSVNWDPDKEKRLTVWEIVQHLIRVLESDGEQGASELVSILGARAEPARELAYRLYTICERKKRSAEALSYNALVQSWPEIVRLAGEIKRPVRAETEEMFE